jgi:hypothetical protein
VASSVTPAVSYENSDALYTLQSEGATNIEYMYYRLAVSEANWPPCAARLYTLVSHNM